MKKIFALLFALCCVAGLAACSQSDELPEDYAIGVIRTIGNKDSSDILYFNADLEQTGSTHYKYATIGELFYPPVVHDGLPISFRRDRQTRKTKRPFYN